MLPAIHTVPAVGYQLDSGKGSLVFTGDTGPNDALWNVVNGIENLKFLIIETAFSDKDRRLAELSKHLCPSMLGEELAKLTRPAEVYITHLKPSEIELTMQEIEELSEVTSSRACCRTTTCSNSDAAARQMRLRAVPEGRKIPR